MRQIDWAKAVAEDLYSHNPKHNTDAEHLSALVWSPVPQPASAGTR